LWASPDGGHREILLPKTATVGDYPTRLAQLLDVLEDVEQRSQVEILRDINCVGLDVVRLRAPETDPKLNSIALRNGARLVDHALEMMSAAALSALEPRRVFSARKPRQALEYIKGVELGQSEEGSYVLTLLSRLELASVEPELLELAMTPFPRRVTRRLASALRATSDALTAVAEDPPAVRLQQQVNAGVSANLCEAIAGMLSEVDGNPSLELQISWARVLPEQDPPDPVRFSRAHAEVLLEAARLLRAEEPELGILIAGVVIDLHREPGSSAGLAKIGSVINGRIRRLNVPLEEADYERAIDAHREQRGVLFHADVERLGRKWFANNVADFQIIVG
jgi:hypothetical protein